MAFLGCALWGTVSRCLIERATKPGALRLDKPSIARRLVYCSHSLAFRGLRRSLLKLFEEEDGVF